MASRIGSAPRFGVGLAFRWGFFWRDLPQVRRLASMNRGLASAKGLAALLLAIGALLAVAAPAPDGPAAGSTIDAAAVPGEQWEPAYHVEASARADRMPDALPLRPVARRPALFRHVTLAATAPRRPAPKIQPMPEYPLVFRNYNTTGQAVVAYVVSAGGEVSDVRVIEATDERFAESACAAVAKWRYRAMRDAPGGPFLCVVEIRFTVRLDPARARPSGALAP